MAQQFHSWAYTWRKTIIPKDTCIPIFIASLLTVVRTWNQSKYLSTEEGIDNLWYIYTTEYYSAIKRNKIPPFAATWMGLEIVILSEVSQTQKDKYDTPYMWNLFFFKGTNELIYKIEIHRGRKQIYGHQGGRGQG